MKKIKKEQLEKIKTQQNKTSELVSQIGLLESQKHALLHEIAKVNMEMDEFKNELEKEYGQVNINLEDGSYSDIEKKELEVVE